MKIGKRIRDTIKDENFGKKAGVTLGAMTSGIAISRSVKMLSKPANFDLINILNKYLGQPQLKQKRKAGAFILLGLGLVGAAVSIYAGCKLDKKA